MNKIIEELLDKGFNLELYKDDHGELCYGLSGFYKSSGVVLRETIPNGLMCWSRYAQMDEIYEFGDLVLLNYRWWQASKDRYEGWNSPEEKWLPYLIEKGLVKKTVETIERYE